MFADISCQMLVLFSGHLFASLFCIVANCYNGMVCYNGLFVHHGRRASNDAPLDDVE